MTSPPESGSHAMAERRGGGLTWLWILLAVVVLALLAWWLLGRDDEEEAADAAPPVVAEEVEEPVEEVEEEPLDDEPVTEVEEEPAGDEEAEESPPVATAGVVLVGDVDLLAADVDPATLVGQTLVAQEVMVQAVVADEAFLVGPDPERTVLVRLPEFAGEGAQESPFNVEAGEAVSFTGTVEELTEELLASLQLVDEEALRGSTGDVYIRVEEFFPED